MKPSDPIAQAIEAELAALANLEGSVACMYLDDDDPGNVTCGRGHLLPTQASALLLPWQIDGQPATPAQIAADYQAVKAAQPGHVWTRYEPMTVCRLAPADQEGLCRNDLIGCAQRLQVHFPQLAQYPVAAIQGALDIEFNCGDFPIARNKAGALEWPSLTRAVLANDWAAAAVQSHRAPPVSAARNAYVRSLFVQASATPQA